ncbi:MAG: DNA-processing protein DprA, partial [Patescibacteria group bacterium]
LYTAGNTDLFYAKDTKFLCVVGSRQYTSYGKELCISLIKSLAGRPVIIISGLALGIDGIAHQTALDVGLPTIAVPGSGLHPNVLYPRSHLHLAEKIIEKGGLLASEYEPQIRASPWSFPMRNRIMAGLSHAVLIIEAEENSGTLVTAR